MTALTIQTIRQHLNRSDLTLDQWSYYLAQLGRLTTKVNWILGDLVAFAETRQTWGDTYVLAQTLTGRSYESLSVMARVSRAFPPDARNDELHWSLYRAALRLPEADRLPVLARAHVERWNCKRLVEYVLSVRQQIEAKAETGIATTDESALANRSAAARMKWRSVTEGTSAPAQRVRCPECGAQIQVRRRGLTESPIEVVIDVPLTPAGEAAAV